LGFPDSNESPHVVRCWGTLFAKILVQCDIVFFAIQ
jgi:hypothetical protein